MSLLRITGNIRDQFFLSMEKKTITQIFKKKKKGLGSGKGAESV